MSAFGYDIIQRELKSKQKPEVLVLNSDQILAEPQIYAKLDLLAISSEDLNSLHKNHFVSINKVNRNICLNFNKQKGLKKWYSLS